MHSSFKTENRFLCRVKNSLSMQRKNRNKLRLIGLLMLLSLLLLAGFTAKWLSRQYSDEKVNLRNRLEQVYTKTNDHIIDSMVHIELGNDLNRAITGQLKGITVSSSSNTLFIDSLSGKRDILIGKPGNDSLPGNFSLGIKRFIIKLKGTTDANGRSLMDTSLLITSLRRNLDKEFRVQVALVAPGTAADALIIPTDNAYHLAISHYRPLLLRKLLPQIGFGALLLLLCGCAFLLSYNTIRRQLRLNAQQHSFISNMSHELKTPVATAKVAIEALRHFNALEDPVKTRDYLRMAAWELDRLETLTSNVLNSMQLAEGRIVLRKEPVAITALLQETTGGMLPLFLREGKTLHTAYEAEYSTVTGDRTHLQGAFYNILDNALKYGGDQVTITVAAQHGRLHVCISDNGNGIPPEYSRKIFERFFRIPSGNVHDVKGYGLGLNYTRHIILSHEGDIRQQNNKEGGAAFLISLPLTQEA